MDERVSREQASGRIASDLGLRGNGNHFYCPGCQSREGGQPELFIKDDRFRCFRCFRCGTQGDVVSLAKLSRRCDLDDAIFWISRKIKGEKVGR